MTLALALSGGTGLVAHLVRDSFTHRPRQGSQRLSNASTCSELNASAKVVRNRSGRFGYRTF
jgi:hypothetical protein